MKYIATASAIALAATQVALAPAANAKAAAARCAPVSLSTVESQFDKFNAAWATKNPDTVTAMFGKGAVLLATVSNKPRTNAAEIRDYFASFLKNSPVGTIETSTYDLGCNMATRVGTWNVRLTNPETGAVSDVKARYTFIYKYEGGRWMIDHLHSSMMPEKAG